MNEVGLFIAEQRDELNEFFEKEEVEAICKSVRETFGVQCICSHVGGYDSTGLDIHCYAVGYIGTDGVLGILDFESISC